MYSCVNMILYSFTHLLTLSISKLFPINQKGVVLKVHSWKWVYEFITLIMETAQNKTSPQLRLGAEMVLNSDWIVFSAVTCNSTNQKSTLVIMC